MYPLNEKPLFKDPKREIALNISHCSKEFIIELIENFYGRYYMEKSNGFLILRIQDVEFDEFAKIVAGYSFWLETGKFHMVFDPPFPRCKVLLTSRQEK